MEIDPDARCAICSLPRRGHWGVRPLAQGRCTGFKAESVDPCTLAAPQMLAALRALFKVCDAHDAPAWNWESAEAMDQARAAIAAAEGI